MEVVSRVVSKAQIVEVYSILQRAIGAYETKTDQNFILFNEAPCTVATRL